MTTFNVKDTPFCAVGDGVADDSAAFQACANATMANRGKMFVPASSGYKITTAIQANKHLVIEGEGYDGYTVNTMRPSGYQGSTIVCGPNNGFVNVQAQEPSLFERFMMVWPALPAGGVAGITLDGPPGCDAYHINSDSVIRDVETVGASIAVKTIDAGRWTIDHLACDGTGYIDILVQNICDPGDGDQNITNCMLSGQPLWHIYVASSGGLRVENNKMNGGNGIALAPTLTNTFGISPFFFVGNSVEGAGIGMLLQRTAGTMQIGTFDVSGNEIYAATQAILAQASGPTPWIVGGTIASNILLVANGGQCVSLDGCQDVGIGSNTMRAAYGAATAIALGPTCVNVKEMAGNLRGVGVA